jgi:hypothetical protein
MEALYTIIHQKHSTSIPSRKFFYLHDALHKNHPHSGSRPHILHHRIPSHTPRKDHSKRLASLRCRSRNALRTTRQLPLGVHHSQRNRPQRVQSRSRYCAGRKPRHRKSLSFYLPLTFSGIMLTQAPRTAKPNGTPKTMNPH